MGLAVCSFIQAFYNTRGHRTQAKASNLLLGETAAVVFTKPIGHVSKIGRRHAVYFLLQLLLNTNADIFFRDIPPTGKNHVADSSKISI